MSNLTLGIFGTVLGVAWALIDAKSFNAYWWLIPLVTLGASIYSAMLKNKIEL